MLDLFCIPALTVNLIGIALWVLLRKKDPPKWKLRCWLVAAFTPLLVLLLRELVVDCVKGFDNLGVLAFITSLLLTPVNLFVLVLPSFLLVVLFGTFVYELVCLVTRFKVHHVCLVINFAVVAAMLVTLGG